MLGAKCYPASAGVPSVEDSIMMDTILLFLGGLVLIFVVVPMGRDLFSRWRKHK